MYAQFIIRWDAIRDSFWFVPAVMSIAGIVLAFVCSSLNGPVATWIVELVPRVAVTTDAARSSLSAIGGAMVSIAGIVFSVMLVTLSITSSQYGSRLLRTFMSDRVTQFSLGMLIATSLFAMVALAGIQKSPQGESVANVSVIIGLLLALMSMAVIIGFIHHVASLIQAPNVVAAVADDLNQSFDRLFPTTLGESVSTEEPAVGLPDEGSGSPVCSNKEGYLQAIDHEALMEIAQSEDLFLRMMVKPGDFIEKKQTLLELWPYRAVHPANSSPKHDGVVDYGNAFGKRVNAVIVVGRRRTPRQDSECAIEELVEVAVRALSPGINDPFTAIACIDRLSAAVGRVAERSMPTPLRMDNNQHPRILVRATEFSDLMDAAFHQIRQNGAQCVAVAIRLLEGFQRIAAHTPKEDRRRTIRRHAEMVCRDFRQHVDEPEDGDDFKVTLKNLLDELA